MNWESIATLIVGLMTGAAGGKLIDWLRYRNKDQAETDATIHDSQTQTLTVTSTLLGQWIQTASNAEATIGELRREKATSDAELRETQHALGLCKESMQRCREKHGCKEG